MLLLNRPSREQIENFAASQIGLPYSYKEVGLTAELVHDGPVARKLIEDHNYVIDHNQICLGKGRATFERAIAAIRKWHQFDLGWVEAATPETPITADSIVCLLVSFTPVRMVFACRIVYAIDSGIHDESPIKKFGFGYGTLAGHPESGEERFLIEWHDEDDSVWYDILAFSRPGTLLTRIGYPFARSMQRRFARDSKSGMSKFVSR